MSICYLADDMLEVLTNYVKYCLENQLDQNQYDRATLALNYYKEHDYENDKQDELLYIVSKEESEIDIAKGFVDCLCSEMCN